MNNQLAAINARVYRDIENGQPAKGQQHTPAPWNADEWATGWTVSAPESHYSVCHLEDCNNAKANARLIAAAPDLLAACADLVHAHDSQMGREAVDLRIEIARAAIAKAKGQP